MRKKAIIVHSGGMDSTLCLAIALQTYQKEELLSLSFHYQQRHKNEIEAARKICHDWGIEHAEIDLSVLAVLTKDALTDRSIEIKWEDGKEASSLVVGRNGLMARLAAIHAHQLGANVIYMGILEEEARRSGYRDCTRHYMDLEQQVLQIDLDDPSFEIRTPIVFMNKKESFALAKSMGILPYLLENTISCYEGIPRKGCGKCPACLLKAEALASLNLP